MNDTLVTTPAQLVACVNAGQAFHNDDRTFTASPLVVRADGVYPGLLPPEHADVLYTPRKVDYVTRSWHTPIAWRWADTGRWVCPKVAFGPATTRHQTLIRAAIAALETAEHAVASAPLFHPADAFAAATTVNRGAW